jgi:hypothetical protein
MAVLVSSLRDRDLSTEMLEVRGASYRRALERVTDDQWLYAVEESLRLLDWFPTVHELLEFVSDAPAPTVARALPQRTEDRCDESWLDDATVPRRWPEEPLYRYLERIAVTNGWMQPLRGRPAVREMVPARQPGEEG